MQPEKERRRHQRQHVLLPLQVTEKHAEGKLLFQGDTVNVGAGGVYFKTPNDRGLRVGMPVHVSIDIPPEMLQLLPFGGLRGHGEVIRVEPVGEKAHPKPHFGVAVRMTSRLRFDPELHLPRLETDDMRPQ